MGNRSRNKIIILFALFCLLGLHIMANSQCKKFIQVTSQDTCSLITLDENTWAEFYMAKKELDTIRPLFYKIDSINKKLAIESKNKDNDIKYKDSISTSKIMTYQQKICILETENQKLTVDKNNLDKKIVKINGQKLVIIGVSLVLITLTLLAR